MTRQILTPQQVYGKLINDEQILSQKGRITFSFGSVQIIVKQRDVVGNLLQEWLQGWFDKNSIYYDVNPNSQMPPDFFLKPGSKKESLLEVKAFNRLASPGFDIADFNMYQKELIESPWMLEVNYLIFGYDMSDKGVVTVKDLWIKKVWEISRSMANWPLNLQIKKKTVHKIRPGAWYRPTTKTFKTKEHFLSAVEETVWQNPDTRAQSGDWKNKFQDSYRKHFKKTISIPRWSDIKDDYQSS